MVILNKLVVVVVVALQVPKEATQIKWDNYSIYWNKAIP